MKKINIYLVDDEKELGEIFLYLFENDSVKVNYYESAKALLAAVQNNTASPPDAFFLDYRMPEINGLKLAELLPKHIPKYLLTGDFDITPPETITGIIYKPYQHDEVLNIFKNLQPSLSSIIAA